MQENLLKVQQAFRILHPLLAGYVAQELSHEYKDSWWQEVLMTLSDQSRDLPDAGEYGELVDSLDIANCLRLFDRKWNDLFKRKLSLDYRTWAKELMGVRNKVAHIGGQDFNNDDTWRALDTMARLCEAFDDEAAEEIRKLLREARYGSAAGSTTVTETVAPTERPKASQAGVLSHTLSGLPSWREVIEPHPDVAQGRYKNAEFAADLAQVARGEGSFEYRDPVEFFARTYVTEGMTGLLVQALKRVRGKDGEPVIQLKTAFGGGKTHSMLALYHMLRGKVSVTQVVLPDFWERPDGTVIRWNSWGEMEPWMWGRLAQTGRRLPANVLRGLAGTWQDLQRENAPLRAVVNGRLMSVPEDWYDPFLRREIAARPAEFSAAQVVGTVLGKYQLGIGDGELACRLEAMVQGGELQQVTYPGPEDPSYHCRLRKTPGVW